MQGAPDERWKALCEEAATEQDPKRLLELVKEISTILQIISRLDELKQILQSNIQPPVSSVSVRGEAFRGDSGARVAIIEYADFECPYCGEYERKTFRYSSPITLRLER